MVRDIRRAGEVKGVVFRGKKVRWCGVWRGCWVRGGRRGGWRGTGGRVNVRRHLEHRIIHKRCLDWGVWGVVSGRMVL